MKLTEHVYFTGVMNPSMRVFDIIMRTEYGTSYNSYVVKGEKAAIVETVHEDYSEEFQRRIEEIVPLEEIEYVILNHTEPDHSGSLKKLLEKNPNMEVIGTSVAIRNLKGIMNQEFKSRAVKTGEHLDLGNGVVLDFILAPNLHWPDSMFTYMAKDGVLFSCDVFGSHFCEPSVLDRYVRKMDEFRKERWNYYNCIFTPFKRFVVQGMDRIKELDIQMICPSHGPVLTDTIEETMEDYKIWSQTKECKTVSIFYVSAYGYTEKMAKILEDTLKGHGLDVKSYNVIEHPMGELAEALNQSSAVLFGSPTINRDALKPIWDLISSAEAINVNRKPAFVFGSYGWSGEACPMLEERLKALKYNVFEKSFACVFSPSKDEEQNLRELAEKFAAEITES